MRICLRSVAMLMLLPAPMAAAQEVAGPPAEPPPPPPPEREYDFLDEPVDFHLAEEEAYYIRFSALITDENADGRVLGSGEPLEFDASPGFSAAIGYTFPEDPIAIEVEWTYRELDPDGASAQLVDGDFDLHTISANLLLDAPNVIGPVGAYAGLGAGVRLNYFRFSSSPGQGGATLDLNGEGFYWQAMAGVTVSVGPSAQMFGGVRWSDAGDIDDDIISVETDLLSFEVGVRLYF